MKNLYLKLTALSFLFLLYNANAQTFDVGAASLTASSGCYLSSQETIEVVIENLGSEDVLAGQLLLNLALNGNLQATEVLLIDLISGASTNYTFLSTLNLSGAGLYTISVYPTLVGTGSGDTNSSNDTTLLTITSQASLTTGFNDGDFLNMSYYTLMTNDYSKAYVDPVAGNPPSAFVLTGDDNNTTYTYASTPPDPFSENPNHTSSVDFCVDLTSGNLTRLYFDLKQTTSYTITNSEGNYALSNFRVMINGQQEGPLYHPFYFGGNDPYQTVVVDLSAYAGQTVDVSFQHNGKYSPIATTASGLGDVSYVDNIQLVEIGSSDAGVASINIAPNNCNMGTNENLEVVVENFGTDTIMPNTMLVTYSINGAPGPYELFVDTLFPQSQTDFIFNNVDLSFSGSLNITSSTLLTGDAQLINDVASASSLNGDVLLDVEILTDNSAWETGWSIINAVTGDVYASVSNGTYLGQNNSLITASLCVPDGASLIFTINDFNANGISGGWYRVYSCGSLVATDGDNFGASDTALFVAQCIPLDAGVTAIPQPSYCQLGLEEPITVEVTNYGTDDIYEFEVSYSLNGGVPVVETVYDTLAQGESLEYVFAATANLSSAGSYYIEAFTSLSGDGNALNDANSSFYVNSDMTAQLSINTINSASQIYWYLDNGTDTLYSYTNESYLNNTTYTYTICLETGTTYNFHAVDGGGNGWEGGTYSIEELPCNVLLANNNGSSPSGFVDSESFTPISNCVLYDAGVSSVIGPGFEQCTYSSTEFIAVQYENYGIFPINELDLAYSINGGPVVQEMITGSMTSLSSGFYTFLNAVDMSAYGTYEVKVWTIYPDDQVPANDTVVATFIHTPNVSVSYMEDLEVSSSILLEQSNTDNIDWALQSGITPSGGTGPTGDHTTGTGNYYYLEASANLNKVAVLESPCIDVTSPKLTFWYHMYGSEMGTLSVEVFDGSAWTQAWSLTGNQGNDWLLAEINLVNFTPNGDFRYRFVGLTGSGGQSDMAIDDILVSEINANDIGISEIIAPTGGCNLTANENVEIIIFNAGAADQTGFNIDYSLDANIIGTYTYTGVIPAFSTDTVEVGVVDLSQGGDYDIGTQVNLSNDQNTINNFLNTTVFNGNQEIVVTILTDFYGEDLGWQIIDLLTGNIVAEAQTGSLLGNAIYSDTVCAMQGASLEFVITDSQANGFGFSSSAYYNVSICGVNVAIGSGNFGSSETAMFVADCPSDFDLSATNISPPYIDCVLNNEQIFLDITNQGAFPIDSFEVSFQVNGGAITSESVVGIILQPLDVYSHAFSVPADLSGLGIVNIDAWVSAPLDTNIANDQTNLTFNSADLIQVDVNIDTDNYPGETTWNLTDPTTGNILFAGGPYNQTYTLFTENICVIDSSTLEFNIYDSANDGITLPGGFDVSICGVSLISGSSYGAGVSETFIAACVPMPPQIENLTEVQADCAPTNHFVCADVTMLNSSLSQIALLVDSNNDGVFQPSPMSFQGGSYCGNILAGALGVPVSYYVVAIGDNGLSDTSQVYTYTDGGLYVDAGPDQSIISGSSTPLNAVTNAALQGVSGSLTTSFSTNNGCSAGNMFDVTANNPVSITGFDVNTSSSAGIATTVNVYYIANNTYLSNSGNQGLWTLHASVNAISAGAGAPTSVPLPSPIDISAGETYAIYVEYAANYITGTGTNQVYGNNDITITTGYGLCSAFELIPNNPRVFSGTVHYGNLSTITWSDPSGIIGNTEYINVAPTQTTTYTVEVTDGFCTESDQVTVVVWQNTDLQTSFETGVTSCLGEDIVVPIQATYFDSVGAISLAFNYDPAVLTYTGFDAANTPQNAIDPFYNLGWQVNNPSPGLVILSWYDVVFIGGEIYMNNGTTPETLVNVLFSATGVGSSNLTWSAVQGECEYSNGSGDFVAAAFINGSVVVSDGPSVDIGSDLTLCEGNPVSVTATATGVAPFSYAWSNGDTTETTSYTPLVSEQLTVVVNDAVGCASTDNIFITVNPAPLADAGPDINVNYGTTVTITASGAGAGGSYLWNTLDQTASITFDALSSGTYTVTVTDVSGCSSVDDMILTVLSGQSVYGNIAYVTNGVPVPGEGPSGDVFIDVVDATGTIIASNLVDVNGSYQIDNVPDGTYGLQITTDRIPPSSASNSTDAQAIQLAFIGTLPLASQMHQIAGDVNESGVVNSSDGLQVRQKFVGLLQDYTSGIDGDTLRWAFSTDTLAGGATPISIMGSDVQYDATGIVYGDVNTSYIPTAKIKEPTVKMISINSLTVDSYSDFTLPVIINQSLQTGAISLVFNYNDQFLDVLDVSMGDSEANQDLIYKVLGNEIRISWMNTNTLHLNKEDAVVNIRFKSKDLTGINNLNFTLNNQLSEFAGSMAQVINSVTLVAPQLRTIKDNLMLANYPNPFNVSTQIEYYLPEEGQVYLGVYNINGELIELLVDEQKSSGLHAAVFKNNKLPAGIYIYKIIFAGANNDVYNLAKRMVINK